MKSVFLTNVSLNLTKAKEICSKYDCISFDVFDTLIKRNVQFPDDIFDIIDYTVQKQYHILGFRKLRIDTENELRKLKRYISIDDIYEAIENKLGKDQAKILKQKEIETEISYCQANGEIFELYKYCRCSGKRIIAISDMYLPADVIKMILSKCGYHIDNLYVSCEYKAMKANGTLFLDALEHECLRHEQIIHIGDNLKCDILGARIERISTIYIKRKNEQLNSSKYINKLKDKNKYSQYLAIINNNLKMQDSFYSKFGFSFLGPLIYNFCLWLKENCIKENIGTIFFLARDGYVLKNAFDNIGCDNIDTKYLYVSRRAIRIPFAAFYSTYEEIMQFFPKTRILTPRVYLENLGLDADNYQDLLAEYNLKLEDTIYYNSLFKEERYKHIFEKIYKDIIAVAKKEYAVLKKYLIQEGFTGKIAIVDVGWHNSMQYYLEKLPLYKELGLDIYGYYLGIQPNEKKVGHSEAFIADSMIDRYARSTLAYIGLIESVFLAPEGSTKTYNIVNGKVCPVLLKYEYSENEEEYNRFSEIRNGINAFIEVLKNLPSFEIYRLNGIDAYTPLKYFGISPYLNDINLFSQFRYFSEEMVYFAKTKSLIYYVKNINTLKKDLYKARWKVGFMKKLIKIPLPYYKIYEIVSKR